MSSVVGFYKIKAAFCRHDDSKAHVFDTQMRAKYIQYCNTVTKMRNNEIIQNGLSYKMPSGPQINHRVRATPWMANTAMTWKTQGIYGKQKTWLTQLTNDVANKRHGKQGMQDKVGMANRTNMANQGHD